MYLNFRQYFKMFYIIYFSYILTNDLQYDAMDGPDTVAVYCCYIPQAKWFDQKTAQQRHWLHKLVLRIIWISSITYAKEILGPNHSMLKTFVKIGGLRCYLWDKMYFIGKTSTAGVGPLLSWNHEWYTIIDNRIKVFGGAGVKFTVPEVWVICNCIWNLEMDQITMKSWGPP
jgi:hypothetical protein